MKMQNYKYKLLILVIALFAGTNFINSQTIKPQFPGGKEALDKYIDEKLIEYESAIILTKNSDDDIVKVRFLVGKTGKISSITAINGTNKGKNTEDALRMVKFMPDWIPGKKKGVATAMYDTLSIDFNIANHPGLDLAISVQSFDRDEIETKIFKKDRIIGNAERRTDVFKTVEQMPQFPGGNAEMLQFIKDNLRYPTIAAENGIQGKVVVVFVVEKDGSLSDIKIVKSIDPQCDREAVRIVKSMPKWQPGKQNGSAVPVDYTLPITFRIQEQEENIIQERNTDSDVAYYCYGTSRELKDIKILLEGGALPLDLSSLKEYFIKINIYETTEIPVYSKGVKFLSEHPENSHSLDEDENEDLIIEILNPENFWSKTRFLVVEVK